MDNQGNSNGCDHVWQSVKRRRGKVQKRGKSREARQGNKTVIDGRVARGGWGQQPDDRKVWQVDRDNGRLRSSVVADGASGRWMRRATPGLQEVVGGGGLVWGATSARGQQQQGGGLSTRAAKVMGRVKVAAGIVGTRRAVKERPSSWSTMKKDTSRK
ncbi:hypothetical protein DFH29DRAFT_874081 [Suillus ampliporus]|nr:hypothetical protein DFH29DRAFT_874081 [Suillus ampliporus]